MSDCDVLLVGADTMARGRLAGFLRELGYDAWFVSSCAEAAATLGDTGFAFTLVDPGLAPPDGPESLETLKLQPHSPGPIILFSNDGHIASTVEAMSPDADPIGVGVNNQGFLAVQAGTFYASVVPRDSSRRCRYSESGIRS